MLILNCFDKFKCIILWSYEKYQIIKKLSSLKLMACSISTDKLFEVFMITHTSGDLMKPSIGFTRVGQGIQVTTETPLMILSKTLKVISVKKSIPMAMAAWQLPKTERAIRQQTLDQIFGKVKRSGQN
jgi:hypothetical protein